MYSFFFKAILWNCTKSCSTTIQFFIEKHQKTKYKLTNSKYTFLNFPSDTFFVRNTDMRCVAKKRYEGIKEGSHRGDAPDTQLSLWPELDTALQETSLGLTKGEGHAGSTLPNVPQGTIDLLCHGAHCWLGSSLAPPGPPAPFLLSCFTSANTGAWSYSSPNADFPLVLAELQEVPGSIFLQLVKGLWMTAWPSGIPVTPLC